MMQLFRTTIYINPHLKPRSTPTADLHTNKSHILLVTQSYDNIFTRRFPNSLLLQSQNNNQCYSEYYIRKYKNNTYKNTGGLVQGARRTHQDVKKVLGGLEGERMENFYHVMMCAFCVPCQASRIFRLSQNGVTQFFVNFQRSQNKVVQIDRSRHPLSQ